MLVGTGDHLDWDRDANRLAASEDYCWYSWPQQADSMERLVDHRFEWVLPELGTPRRMAFERMFAGFSPKPNASVETRSIEFQRGMLSASDRISIVTRQETRLEERIGVLAALPFAPPVSRNADGIATRANWRTTIVQLAFIDLLRRPSRDSLSFPRNTLQPSDPHEPTAPGWPARPLWWPPSAKRATC